MITQASPPAFPVVFPPLPSGDRKGEGELPATLPAPGTGFLHVEYSSNQSRVTHCHAQSPLRLLTPRNSTAAWIYTSTFGGGLLSGDNIRLNLTLGPDATCLLSTQSQTKIYRSTTGRPATQSLTATVAPSALLVCLPDPVSPFADSIFHQRQQFELSSTSSLVYLDWLTSGRRARGERWSFRRYQTFTDVRIENRLVFRDALRLDRSDGAIDAPHRMGQCDCFATLLLLGPKVSSSAAIILKWVSNQPVTTTPILFAASPVADGAVIRIAGSSTESVARWLRDRLNFLPSLLGGNPWERKW